MGIMDSIKKGVECTKDKSIQLNITFGYKDIGIGSVSTMRQKEDGSVYFNFSDSVLYDIVSYSWNGPEYEEVIKSDTQTSTTKKKKGKAGKMTAGALVGTMLFPGVGTAVGAAIGAGGKGKENISGQENTTQTVSKVEKDTTAIIVLRNKDTQRTVSLTIKCNTDINSKLSCFDVPMQNEVKYKSSDAIAALNGIKALKELLDMGAITQEEFDAKKKELL